MLQDHLAWNIVDEDSKFEDEKTKQTKDAKQQSDRPQKLKAWGFTFASTRSGLFRSKRIEISLSYFR